MNRKETHRLMKSVTLSLLVLICMGPLSFCKKGAPGADDDPLARGERVTGNDESKQMNVKLKKPDPSVIYRLPYAPGSTYEVTQGYYFGGTHDGIYAIDWTMPEGTPILAVREGTVVFVRDTNRFDPATVGKYGAPNNWIEIRHGDGTIAHYGHIMRGSAKVRVGQAVKAGDPVAQASNVGGFNGDSHLHFQVHRIVQGKPDTMPVLFWSGGDEPYEIMQGIAYYAPRFKGDVKVAAKGKSELGNLQAVLVKVGKKGSTRRESRKLIRDHLLANAMKYRKTWRDLKARVEKGDAAAAGEMNIIMDQCNLETNYELGKMLENENPDDLTNEIAGIMSNMLQ